MRIIGGQIRGTKLIEFDGKQIRPTLDRVKESLFNQIQPYLEGACFLDLFAGTGAIGLEAWSRGANSAVLVEKDSLAFEVIRDNLERCKVGNGVTAMYSDSFQALNILESEGAKFDMVYVDPPFNIKIQDLCLRKLSTSNVIKETSMIIVEHHHKTILPENCVRMHLIRQRKIGDTRLSFYGYSSLFS